MRLSSKIASKIYTIFEERIFICEMFSIMTNKRTKSKTERMSLMSDSVCQV